MEIFSDFTESSFSDPERMQKRLQKDRYKLMYSTVLKSIFWNTFKKRRRKMKMSK